MERKDHKSIEVYCAHFPTELPERLYNAYLSCLPKTLRETNQRYRRWQDRHAHLLGKLLLIEGLRRYGLGSEIFGQLLYTQHDKPYLDSDIDFNISHSGHYVLCAVGKDLRLGVDIEEVSPIDLENFEAVMSAEQWHSIRAASNVLQKFYEHWTIKESIIKADGRGVTIPLKDLRWKAGVSMYEGVSWNIQSIPVADGYVAHLTTSLSGLSVKVKAIDFFNERLFTNWHS